MKGIYARASNSADYLQKRCVWTKAVMEQSVTTSSEELLAEYGHAQNGTVFRYWTCDKNKKQKQKKQVTNEGRSIGQRFIFLVR